VYGRDDLERPTFIRRCREFDFSTEQVGSDMRGAGIAITGALVIVGPADRT
jgi:hypothetical protein